MPLVFLLSLTLSCGSEAEVGLPSRPDNLTCIAPPRPDDASSVQFERVEGVRFSSPIDLTHDGERWYTVEQAGVVEAWVDDGRGDTQEVLDIRDRVRSGGELGLLGFALHPDWPDTPEAFAHYTDSRSVSTISRFTSADGEVFDAGSEEVLLTLQQPYSNHNGGDVAFGLDGYLYISFGDGGSQGDPDDNGQDPSTWLAAILRIDVDGASADASPPYAIPPSNPFADGVDGAPEVYAYGLRNPWRIAFDPLTGELWTGDVGQNQIEEVDRVVSGGNYGWNHKEGLDCYSEDPCDGPEYIDPVAWYDHRDGVSITGGYVYRGTSIPGLAGSYIYGDYVSAKVWGVFINPETGETEGRELGQLSGVYISAFGQSPDGELLVADYSRGNLYRMLPGEDSVTPTKPFPQLLSETGCMHADDPSQPGSGLLPYGVNHPLWSDGAEKERYVAFPPGSAATLVGDEVELPIGSVLVKQFRVAGELVETRLYMRHSDGGWAPYTYEWLADGSDAVLTRAGGVTETADGGSWDVPSSSQCVACHTAAAGFTLGMELGQLNGELSYPGGNTANQLATWSHLGLLDTPLPGSPEELTAFAPPEAGADAARAYLHVQCAVCHQPNATAPGELDLRYGVPLAEMKICGVEPSGGDMGVDGALLLAPGDPTRSMISLRVGSTDPLYRMPSLGTAVVDTEGLAALDAWISSLDGCE